MIKVIVGYKVKKGVDLEPILLRLRSHATQYAGFISAESYLRKKNGSVIMVVYTWQNAQGWTAWQKSTIRQELLKEAQSLLEDKPRVTIYTVVPSVRWI